MTVNLDRFDDMSGRTFVMGDIHGNLKALDQCLERSGFDTEMDTLIQLGDVSDRLPDTARVVERLLTMKNLIAIRGNHDAWTLQWITSGVKDPVWVRNGGQETLDSYEGAYIDEKDHRGFYEEIQSSYHIDEQNRIFVHGGFTHPDGPAFDEVSDQCLWNRSLWSEAMAGADSSRKPALLNGFKEIYIGHTPTLNWFQEQPMHVFNVWNMDTGAGHPNGRLSMMDLESKKIWQSDMTSDLYDL